MGTPEFGVRRYRSRTAARPGGGTDHGHQPRLHAFERHGRHHPRRSNAGAAYGSHEATEPHAKPPQPRGLLGAPQEAAYGRCVVLDLSLGGPGAGSSACGAGGGLRGCSGRRNRVAAAGRDGRGAGAPSAAGGWCRRWRGRPTSLGRWCRSRARVRLKEKRAVTENPLCPGHLRKVMCQR